MEENDKVDKIWTDIWAGGITNPLTVIEQLTYLMFIRSLDEKEQETESLENMTGEKMPKIFPQSTVGQSMRWSKFKNSDPREIYEIISKRVFPSLKEMWNGQLPDFDEKTGELIPIPGSPADCAAKARKAAEQGQPQPEEELEELVKNLNEDDTVDGILVQLPLPKHISEAKVIETIAREKDVDGFHPLNVAALWQKQPCVLPCTPKGIIRMLKTAGVQISGKRAVVIGRSNIVGLPVAKLLLDENATVTIAHSRTQDLPSITRQAEILVVAIGRPKFVTADMVSEGTAVIDVGVNRDPETGKLCGDVDFASIEPKASVITPVPGGVGPMTICCLMENTIECFLAKVAPKA